MSVETILVAVILVEAAALALAVLAIVGHAIWSETVDRAQRRRVQQGRPLLIAALERQLTDEEVGALARLGRRATIRLVAEIAPSLSGEPRAALRDLVVRLGIVAHAERGCRGRLWWRRLYAARLLTLADAGDAVMPALLGDPHPLVRAQAAEWASEHPTPSTLRALTRLLDDPQRIARFAVEDTLLRIGRPAVAPLAEQIDGMGPVGVQSALVVAARLGDAALLPVALRYATHDIGPVRAGAADVLGALGGDEAIAALVGLLHDRDPMARAAAARGIGRLAHWPSATALVPLLNDRSWSVRRASAVALRDLGAPGAVLLRRALGSSDRFAAEIAAQALGAQPGRA